jgi:hypothetical protein
VEENDSSEQRGVDRRKFLAAFGAVIGAGALLDRGGGELRAQSPTAYLYEDSFGNIGPANPTAVALGIYPPPIPSTQPGQQQQNTRPPNSPGSGHDGAVSGGHHVAPTTAAERMHPRDNSTGCTPANNSTYYNTGWPKYNILLVMVDQMRNPTFWPPAGANGQTSLYNLIPNISGLMDLSWVFPNYFVNATACTPSRSAFLTGMYATQTCMSRTQSAPSSAPPAPSLVPYSAGGFPSIGDVLSQCLYVGQNGVAGTTPTAKYDCTWIGKWHVSCDTGTQDLTPGANGPSDYGFTDSYSLPNTGGSASPYPNTSGYPSPNGTQNEGNGGDFLDSYTYPAPPDTIRDYSNYTPPAVVNSLPGQYRQLNDSAIATAFGMWLANAEINLTNQKWFCAVSFVNPHDMSDFPYSYGLCPPIPSTPGQTLCGTDFCSPRQNQPSPFLHRLSNTADGNHRCWPADGGMQPHNHMPLGQLHDRRPAQPVQHHHLSSYQLEQQRRPNLSAVPQLQPNHQAIRQAGPTGLL